MALLEGSMALCPIGCQDNHVQERENPIALLHDTSTYAGVNNLTLHLQSLVHSRWQR